MDEADCAFAFGMLTGCKTHYNIDENDEGGKWSCYVYQPITTNKPGDYDWDTHWTDAGTEREFATADVVAVLKELHDKGFPLTASCDEHAISILQVSHDQVQLRNQATRGSDGRASIWWADIDEIASGYKYIQFIKWTPPLI
eukprot:TRINITY_DN11108_c0_g2_i2.p1 TRINITY_DN11108_c0_g2~~TRINITY_DN11108_c0_g2_i2.p1  ORF type:complete len:142 (-),score=28.75 TRINITY_DN11108_c0_g2_i2:671-1096(-)